MPCPPRIQQDGILRAAAARGDTEHVLKLLDDGVDVDAADKCGRTALMQAAMRGRLETVEALLRRRADPSRKDGNGRTALEWAVLWNEQAAAGHLESPKDFGSDTEHPEVDANSPRGHLQRASPPDPADLPSYPGPLPASMGPSPPAPDPDSQERHDGPRAPHERPDGPGTPRERPPATGLDAVRLKRLPLSELSGSKSPRRAAGPSSLVGQSPRRSRPPSASPRRVSFSPRLRDVHEFECFAGERAFVAPSLGRDPLGQYVYPDSGWAEEFETKEVEHLLVQKQIPPQYWMCGCAGISRLCTEELVPDRGTGSPDSRGGRGPWTGPRGGA